MWLECSLKELWVFRSICLSLCILQTQAVIYKKPVADLPAAHWQVSAFCPPPLPACCLLLEQDIPQAVSYGRFLKIPYLIYIVFIPASKGPVKVARELEGRGEGGGMPHAKRKGF